MKLVDCMLYTACQALEVVKVPGAAYPHVSSLTSSECAVTNRERFEAEL